MSACDPAGNPRTVTRIYARTEGYCHWCQEKIIERPGPLSFTLDHVVPLEYGGTNTEANLVAAHRDCARRRREWRQRLEAVTPSKS